MKRYFITLLLFAVVISISCKKNSPQVEKDIKPATERTSLESEHLLGVVQEIVDTKFLSRPLKDGRDTLYLHSIKKQTYNRHGMLTNSLITTAEGDTVQRMQSTYNQKGKIVRSDFFGKDGKHISYVIYTHDNAGYRIKEEHYENDTLSYTEEFSNDEHGNVLLTTVSNGAEKYYIRYTNDKNGYPIKAEWYNEGISKSSYQTQLFEYDSRGNIINRQVTLAGNRSVEYYHAQYDEKGHILKDVYQGSLPNQLVEVVTKYGVRDSHGNWTHKEVYQNQQKDYLIERTIKYY